MSISDTELPLSITPIRARRYNRALLLWMLALIALAGVGLALLAQGGRLPAPPITATNCIDEKFKFLHDTETRSPNLIAVGSSVTWRNLDFDILKKEFGPAVQPLNAAPCYLHVNQTAFLTNFLIDNMPSVQTVLSVFSLRDFSGCANRPSAFFDVDDAQHYVFDRHPGWHLYFKNFRPRSFLFDAMHLPEMRSGRAVYASLRMDPYGSGPMQVDTPDPWENVHLDRSCLAHLKDMAENLDCRGIRFVAVLLPAMPGWIKAHDPEGRRDAEFRSAVSETLRGSRAIVLDANRALELEDRHFTDAAHLQWSSVPLLMDYLTRELAHAGLFKPAAVQEANNAL